MADVKAKFKEVTVIKATSLPISADFEIDPDLFPESVPVLVKMLKWGRP